MPQTVFRTPELRASYLRAYDSTLAQWPVRHEEFDVPTSFGLTHGVVTGAAGTPPLVLLHGNFASLTSWRHLVAALSADHRVYALDTIDDLGKSVPERLPQSRPDYAAWLKEAVTGLKLNRPSLVGHSYGGFLALNLALAEPTLVDRLVLLAPGVPFAPPTPGWMWGMPMVTWPSPATVRLFFAHASVKGFAVGDPELEQLMTGIPGLRTHRPLRPVFTADELGCLSLPTLLLIGDREILYQAGRAVSRAREWCPQLTAEIVPNAGHTLCMDQPEIVSERIRRFLAS